MTDVTQILAKIEAGDQLASNELLPLVYDELRKLATSRMASERRDHTLQATALVHEAYLRLVDGKRVQNWESRGHFFAAAAESMRRILINGARDKKRVKRGGRLQKLNLNEIEIALETPADELLALDEALEQLGDENEIYANLVKLRFFAGLSIPDAAAALGISKSTADRYWVFARAYLGETLQRQS